MPQRFAGFRNSVTAKILTIGGLLLLMLIPLAMIEELVSERDREKAHAESDIASSWGSAQVIGGPVLIVPFRYRRLDSHGAERLLQDEIYLLPLELMIEGGAEMQVLNRGIYEIPVYSASLSIAGRLRPVEIDADTYDGLEILWGEAELGLPVSDPHAIRSPVALELGGETLTFEPGDARVSGLGNMLRASLEGLPPERFAGPQTFSLELSLGGTSGLFFRPDGDLTSVSLASGWPSPSFRGAWLPEDRTVDADGFTAAWQVMGIGRGYPSVWRESEGDAATTNAGVPALQRAASGTGPVQPYTGSSFGVEFFVPVGIHTSSLRAVRYAELYLAVTFAAFFLFEVFTKIRLHPIQYLSVGLANGIFYLLLLALAEHAGFLLAYFASAIGSIGLIGGYAASILRSTRRALPIVALLTVLYVYLFTTLRAEDHALLAGALGLFVLLGAFMYLTRGIDWYAIELGGTNGNRDEQAADQPA